MSEDVWDPTMKIQQLFMAVMTKPMAAWLSTSVQKTIPKFYTSWPTLPLFRICSSHPWPLWVLVSAGHPLGIDGLGVSAVGTALLFPPLQLFAPPCLLFTHAVPEGLHLWLALSPVLVLGHALLHCIVRSSTARTGNQLVQWVLFLTLLLHLLDPGMALSWHLWESLDSNGGKVRVGIWLYTRFLYYK